MRELHRGWSADYLEHGSIAILLQAGVQPQLKTQTHMHTLQLSDEIIQWRIVMKLYETKRYAQKQHLPKIGLKPERSAPCTTTEAQVRTCACGPQGGRRGLKNYQRHVQVYLRHSVSLLYKESMTIILMMLTLASKLPRTLTYQYLLWLLNYPKP